MCSPEREVLTKTYNTEQESDYSMALQYNTITVDTPIEWKPGKNVTVEMVPKKVPAERGRESALRIQENAFKSLTTSRARKT